MRGKRRRRPSQLRGFGPRSPEIAWFANNALWRVTPHCLRKQERLPDARKVFLWKRRISFLGPRCGPGAAEALLRLIKRVVSGYRRRKDLFRRWYALTPTVQSQVYAQETRPADDRRQRPKCEIQPCYRQGLCFTDFWSVLHGLLGGLWEGDPAKPALSRWQRDGPDKPHGALEQHAAPASGKGRQRRMNHSPD